MLPIENKSYKNHKIVSHKKHFQQAKDMDMMNNIEAELMFEKANEAMIEQIEKTKKTN